MGGNQEQLGIWLDQAKVLRDTKWTLAASVIFSYMNKIRVSFLMSNLDLR